MSGAAIPRTKAKIQTLNLEKEPTQFCCMANLPEFELSQFYIILAPAKCKFWLSFSANFRSAGAPGGPAASRQGRGRWQLAADVRLRRRGRVSPPAHFP